MKYPNKVIKDKVKKLRIGKFYKSYNDSSFYDNLELELHNSNTNLGGIDFAK